MNVLGFGILIFIAFWVIFLRLQVVTRLKIIAHPFLMDVTVTIAVILMYGGTGLGLLAGTMAGVLVSISISTYRARYGFIRKDIYHIGRVNLTPEIEAYIRKEMGAKHGRHTYSQNSLET